MFIRYIQTNPWFFFSWIFVIILSICVHEFAHAFVALKRGDDTAARQGHLSLNPLVQMGPTSLFMLAIIGVAWGAVPINPARYRTRGDAALVAFAGPAANLLLAVAFGVLALLLRGAPVAADTCVLGCQANGVLFVLNMLPVPMLDGWSVFSMFFPALERVTPQQAQTVSLVALMLIFVSPLGDFVWSAGLALGGVWLRVLGVVG